MHLERTFDLLIDKLQGWLSALVLLLPNLLAALLVMLAFVGLAKLARRGMFRIAGRFDSRGTLARLLINIATFGVGLIGLIIALNILQLEKTVLSLLAGVGVIGLALGFAFQDIAANFMSGVLIAVRRPLRVGEIVKTQDYFGKVTALDLRNTEIRTPAGQVVLIPNKEVFQSALTNYSRSGGRRVDLPVGVSYGDDLPLVARITREAVEKIPSRDASRDVELMFTEFGDSSINLVVRFWIAQPSQAAYLAARSEAVMSVKRAYDANEITIPFPIRTLDFGIKGGATLGEIAPALTVAGGAQGPPRS